MGRFLTTPRGPSPKENPNGRASSSTYKSIKTGTLLKSGPINISLTFTLVNEFFIEFSNDFKDFFLLVVFFGNTPKIYKM